MTTTTVKVNLQYELEDYNIFTKKKPIIMDMQGVRWDQVNIHSCIIISTFLSSESQAKMTC